MHTAAPHLVRFPVRVVVFLLGLLAFLLLLPAAAGA